MMAARTASLRDHLASLAAAAPRLPGEFRSAADRLLAELHGRRLVGVLILVLGFVALGAGTEWVFRRVTAHPQQRIAALPIETASERMRAIGLRLAFGLSEVAIFGLGSIGAFLAFDWPPLLRQVVLAYLVAAVVLRLALVLGRFLLAPDGGGPQDAERFRVIPLSADAARFWFRRLALFVGWFAFGRATLDVLSALGFSPEARELVAYTLGLGLLAIALNVVWARPRASDALPDDARGTPPVTGSPPGFCPFAWCCSGGSGSSGSCACSGSWRSRSSCPGRSRSPGWRAIMSPVLSEDPRRRPRQG